MDNSPIGIFDSGIGGLSILDKVHQLLPNEKLLYVSDSGFAPYGQKSNPAIQERCLSIMDFFVKKNVKAVVVACNTATAAAIALLRQKYIIPIIGVEPAIKPAAQQSRSGIIGVLATTGTVDSDKFINLHGQYSNQVEIITTACPGLVEQIEKVDIDQRTIKLLLEEFTTLFKEKGGDTLVLGCTHYPLIKDMIIDVVGNQVKIIDTGFAVAKELQRQLLENKLATTKINPSGVTFYSSGNLAEQKKLISHFWKKKVTVSIMA